MTDYPFTRTSCACTDCTKLCKRQPGPLVDGDLDRILDYIIVKMPPIEMLTRDELAQKFFCASPGALVKISDGSTHRVGTIVPQMKRGRCVFLDENDRCKIHAVAPFGCSHFDTHMSRERAHARSIWAIRHQVSDEYREQRNKLPYCRSYKPNPF
jgi:Fe-S-cluster containining protein